MRSDLTHRELTALDGLITILQSSTSNNTFNHYFSENNGISMEYPSSWERQQNISDPNLALFFPSVSPKSAVVTVNKYKLQNISNEDSQQIFDMYSLALMKNINNNFNISSIKSSKISNATAYEVDFHDGKNVTILWTYKDSYVYSIMYVSDITNYGKYLPVFKDMINSLTIRTISKSNFANFYDLVLKRYLDVQKQ
jgi:hypothetical protein